MHADSQRVHLKSVGRALATAPHHGVIDELGVVAQLLERGDGGQDLGRLLAVRVEQVAGDVGLQEVAVQAHLQVTHAAAHHLNYLQHRTGAD